MKINRNIKAGIWYTVSNFVSRGLIFLTTPIFTRIMTKSEFGIYSNYASWLNIITILGTLELYTSLSRAWFDHKEDREGYISSITCLGLIWTILCYVLVNVFQEHVVVWLGMDMKYIHVMFGAILFAPAMSTYLLKQRFSNQYISVVVVTVFSAIASTGLAVAGVFFSSNHLMAKIAGEAIPIMLVNFLLFFIIMSKGKVYINIQYWKYALMISLPLIPHLLAHYVLSASDKIMTRQICGAEDAALYSLAYTCATVIYLFYDSMNKAWLPWLMERLHRKEYEIIRRNSLFYFLFFVLLTNLFMLIAPEILFVMGGAKYYEARFIMPSVILAIVFQFGYTLYVNIELYEKRTIGVSVGTVMAATINIVLNILLLPRWGYQAAAITTLLGYLSLIVFHYLAVRRMGYHKVYNTKLLLIILGFEVLWTCLMTYLYLSWKMRALLVGLVFVTVLFGTFVLWKKRYLYKWFHKLK